MVAKTPPKQQKRMAMAAVPLLNPILLRETVKKVDRCMERLQELQCTVSGGTKVISGKTLSPRSTRGYLRTSIRCKQESLRLKNSGCRKSPVGKFQGCAVGCGEWRRMSLPAMLVGETVGEILQASQFAKQVVAAVTAKTTKKITTAEPKTPVTDRRNQKIINCENTELRSRRKKEKQVTLKLIRSESDSPTSLPRARARARINFKVVSPNKRAEIGKENWHIANRVSPKNRPWAKKTVLFPNPLFNNLSPTSQKKRFCKTKSPVISRGAASRQTPHKFVIKSPTSTSKFQVKIKSPPVSLSPTRPIGLNKKSPTKISTASKLRRSFSPSRLANRLVSPLKNRMAAQKSSVGLVSGLKQQPLATTTTTPVRFLDRKI